MSVTPLKDRSVAYLVTISITVFLGTAGLFFTIGSSFSKNKIEALEVEIKVFELAEDIELRELLPALVSASEELKTNLEIVSENARLREENSSLTSQLEVINEDQNQLIEEKNTLEAQLEAYSMVSESFTLSENTSRIFGAYDLTLGVVDIYIDYVDIIFDNENYRMKVGEVLSTTINGEAYQLILEGFEYADHANFVFIASNDN